MRTFYKRQPINVYKRGRRLTCYYRGRPRPVRLRNGYLFIRLRRKWNRIRRQPKVWAFGKWRKLIRGKRKKIVVRIGRGFRRFKCRRGRLFLRTKNKRWSRLRPRNRTTRRKGRLRRRKIRYLRKKLRRIRRYKRRYRLQMRRLRRFRGKTTPLKLRYRNKTRFIYRWKRYWTVGVAGRRRRIR
ncbi:PREDICTED: uncharacterized protein LOC107334988 [Acropora digitifera]|uniref:uncharacterized protein LOC107334988 n=1 Tax=Acropora digitifera TaxID=70779 RepID=UPI00077B0E75|nr:PREDICTED: uncharacterized protein LOC107334988 [Acropora digitifera]